MEFSAAREAMNAVMYLDGREWRGMSLRAEIEPPISQPECVSWLNAVCKDCLQLLVKMAGPD